MKSWLFFRFTTYLEQSGSQVPYEWSNSYFFINNGLLTKTFSLVNCFEISKKELLLPKNSDFLQKSADFSKIKPIQTGINCRLQNLIYGQ